MESIKEKLKKSKVVLNFVQKPRFFVVSVLILAMLNISGVYYLQRLFKEQSLDPVWVKESAFEANKSGKVGDYVASKTGKTYYYPWCGAANRIKESNLIWFPDRAPAEQKGYKPAANCHGLK